MREFWDMLSCFLILIGVSAYMLWTHNLIGLLTFIAGISVGLYFFKKGNHEK